MLSMRVITLALLALIVCQPLQAQTVPPPVPGATRVTGPYVEPATQIEFPATLGPLHLTSVRDYELQQKGLGVSMRYVEPRGTYADVYVYNLNQTGIPDGIYDSGGSLSELMRQVFVQSIQDIRRAEQAGIWKEVTMHEPRIMGQPDRRETHVLAVRAQFRVSHPPEEEKASVLALYGYRSHFIKVRYTENRETYDISGGRTVSEFISALVAVTIGQGR